VKVTAAAVKPAIIELTGLTDSGGAAAQVGVAVDDKGDVFKITV
jgi:hypothetical protein